MKVLMITMHMVPPVLPPGAPSQVIDASKREPDAPSRRGFADNCVILTSPGKALNYPPEWMDR